MIQLEIDVVEENPLCALNKSSNKNLLLLNSDVCFVCMIEDIKMYITR